MRQWQIPQPSDDPNDPLNWPIGRRDLITFVLSMAGIFATSLGSILAANTVTIIRLFGVELTPAAVLTGYVLLGAGAAAIFFVPSARVWGKRHLFLIGIAIVIGSSAWAGAVHTSYGSLAGARVVQGFGIAPFESLLNAAVGDLYFVHERGIRMALTTLAVFGSAFFTPIVSGKITHSLGWQWTFNFVAIFSGVIFIAVFFLCPETAYRRDSKLNLDTGSGDEAKLQPRQDSMPPAYSETAAKDETSGRLESSLPTASINGVGPGSGFILVPFSRVPQNMGNAGTPKKTYVESLSLFDGTKTDENYWVLLFRPFPLILNPAFIWGCLIQGTMIGWTIFIGIVTSSLFIGFPYLWGETKSGYTYAAAFIGALGGFLVSGLMADPVAMLMTRRNNGVYEPEFRMTLIIPMFITGSIGLFGFALTAGEVINQTYTYMVPLTFFAFEVASMVIGAVGSALYVVDAYSKLYYFHHHPHINANQHKGDSTIEAFTLMIIFKNFFSFILTWFAFEWLSKDIKNTMLAVSAVQVVVCATTIPMCKTSKSVYLVTLHLTNEHLQTSGASDAEPSTTSTTLRPNLTRHCWRLAISSPHHSAYSAVANSDGPRCFREFSTEETLYSGVLLVVRP